ncbi:sulfuric ester hydrolase [Aureococcus anophagefferens]|nr:sulfuric ester hydrolase [Aureococcus anophagefferens]
MGKKSRRKPEKKQKDDDEDWGQPDAAGDQDWWVAGEGGDAIREAMHQLGDASENPEHPLAARDRAFGLSPITQRMKREKKRRPACDVCGAEDAKFKCVRCNAQYYCGKECQAEAWGAGGHKRACRTLRAASAAAAAAVVAQLNDASLPAPLRVRDLDRLDTGDVYEPAVEFGLHAARALLSQCGVRELRDLFAHSPMACSVAQFVGSMVFRGERRSRAGSGGFGKSDGARLAAFFESADDAWDVYLRAIATLARAATDRAVAADPRAHALCHRAGRDALCSLVTALARREVAGALLEARGGDGDFVRARALASAKLLKKLLDHLAAVSEREDPNSTLEANANQIVAMFAHWCRVHDVGVDVDRVVGLKGARREMYARMAVPLARLLLACVAAVRAVPVVEALPSDAAPTTTGENAAPLPSDAAPKPHIVYFLVDDLGWHDVPWHNPSLKTPTLAALAADGVVLDRFYAYRFCSPSRSSLLSGRYPMHVNQYNMAGDALGGGVHVNMTTIAKKLKGAGYATHQLGKWHAGQSSADLARPACGVGNFVDLYATDGPAFGKNGTYGAQIYHDAALDIIADHDASVPLFVYFAFQINHAPMQVPDAYARVYPCDDPKTCGVRSTYQAMTAMADDVVRNATAALKAKGMWDDTLIVLTSDNGGPSGTDADSSNNFPLRGGKYSDLEGGVRAAGLVAGGFLPDAARGRTLDGAGAYVHICDWYATFARLAGPGGSGGGYIGGRYKVVFNTQSPAIWNGPEYPNGTKPAPISTDCGASGCLFDVVGDPSEYVDLAAELPDVLANLTARWKAAAATADQTPYVGGAMNCSAPRVKAMLAGGFWTPWTDDHATRGAMAAGGFWTPRD